MEEEEEEGVYSAEGSAAMKVIPDISPQWDQEERKTIITSSH